MSVRLIGWAMLVFAWSSVVEAAEIKVLSAGAVKAVIVNVGDQFEKESGHKLSASFGTVGVTRQKLAAEPADVVIMTDVAICCCASSAIPAVAAPSTPVRNVCGFFGMAGFAAKARSLR